MPQSLERKVVERLINPELLELIDLAEQRLKSGETLTRIDLIPICHSIADGVGIAEGAWHLSIPVKGDILSPDDSSLGVMWEKDGRPLEEVKVEKRYFQISLSGDISVVGLYDGRETRVLTLINHPELYLKAAREVAQTLQLCKQNPELFSLSRWETYATLHGPLNTSSPEVQS